MLPDGRLRVIHVWGSEADWDNFRRHRLDPAVEEVAGEGAPVPEVESHLVRDFALTRNPD